MGRGKSQKSLDLIDAAAAILEEIQPCSVRAVCYKLFTQGVIPSISKVDTNRVGTQLVWAREQGIIPWEWIVDETREAETVPSWDSPDEILELASRSYRRDSWSLQPSRVEVWSEKGTVRGTLAPILNAYGVTFRVMHGYASATTVYDVAKAVDGKPLIALYVGDYDPSGLHMSEVDLPARLGRYRLDRLIQGEPRPEDETLDAFMAIDLIRVALTAEDAADPDLPDFDADTKRGDPRWRWYQERYGPRCWELDAMSPPVLRARVEDAILALIEPEAWERCRQAQEVERESLASVLGAYRTAKSRQASE